MNPYRYLKNRWTYRWRWLYKEQCPLGSRVDLWTKAPEWEHCSFGLTTIRHPNVHGVCWNDGDKGVLVTDPKITRWRYSDL